MITFALLAFFTTLVSSSTFPRVVPYYPALMLPPSPEPSPQPSDPLVIACRNTSCHSTLGEFICVNHDNSTAIPPPGLTRLLFAEQFSVFEELNFQYQAMVPSLFVDWGFLGFIPWQSIGNNRTSRVHCQVRTVLLVGKPFVGSPETGWCCPPCTWLSGQISKPPSFLCCGIC